MRRRGKSRGFTLIELMIIVGIVAILAAIAIPNYQLHRFRSRTAEIASLAASIRNGQETFYAEFDGYANIPISRPAGAPFVVKRVWDGPPCPAGCNRNNLAACTEFSCIHFNPQGMVYYSYMCPSGFSGTSPEYVIGAFGDVDGDGVMGWFNYQTSNIGNPVGELTAGPVCVPMAPNEIHNCTPMSY